MFQAERQTIGSSYRLTLSGFNAAPSECRPVCGDGILGIGEECDDGKNAGGYGVCGPGCKLGEYCGDGIVQTGLRGLRRRREHRHALSVGLQEAHRQLTICSIFGQVAAVEGRPVAARPGMALAKSLLASIGVCDL